MTTEIPLFPLRSVLCPGVALPLHIFEERYRLMIERCIERGEPFGVVLVQEGSEVGPLTGRIAEIGTTAAIRRAGKYPDGRFDILTVGQQRFHLESVDSRSEPYLVGYVSMLDEPIGPVAEARAQAKRVGRRFLQYLELLQADTDEDGPEIEIELEIEVDADDVQPAEGATAESVREHDAPDDASEDVAGLADGPVDAGETFVQDLDAADLSDEQRHELLMAAARRLTGTDDPTALSYVLTALIQVDLSKRQDLLEAPDTVDRLVRLDGMLVRETFFLKQGLRPVIIDPGQFAQGGK